MAHSNQTHNRRWTGLILGLAITLFATAHLPTTVLAKGKCSENSSEEVQVDHLDDLQRVFSIKGKYIRQQRRRLKGWLLRKNQGKPVLVLTVPSLNLPKAEVDGILGIEYYEHRALWNILKARDPNVHVLFVTSTKVPSEAIDHLLEGIPRAEAEAMRRRIHIYSLNDLSPEYLSEKVRNNPEAIHEIHRLGKKLLGEPITSSNTSLSGFITDSSLGRLAANLGVPVTGMNPLLNYLNSKSGNRELAAEAHIPYPIGFNHNMTTMEIVNAIDALYLEAGGKGSAFVKTNFGTSGQGIIHVPFAELGIDFVEPGKIHTPTAGFNSPAQTLTLKSKNRRRKERQRRIRQFLENTQDEGGSWKDIYGRILKDGAVTENGVVHDRSPSVQLDIGADGKIELLSTHMQILAGRTYKGSNQPAYVDPQVTALLTGYAMAYANTLARYQVVGRVALDFFEVRTADGKVDFVFGEANIREGGTTHPRETVALLMNAEFDPALGVLVSRTTGTPVFYSMTDNFVDIEAFKGVDLTALWGHFTRMPEYRQLRFNSAQGTGVKFHMMSALSPIGKTGLTAFGRNPSEAQMLLDKAESLLTKAARQLYRGIPPQ